MNLAQKIEQLWKNNKSSINKKTESWIKDLQNAQKCLKKAKREFHQWFPLRAYVSIGKSKSHKKHAFSLRFFGQEVANVIVKNKDVFLELKGHAEKNWGWFPGKLPACCLKDGCYPWNGPDAKKFRSHFKKLAVASEGKPKVKCPEHRVESKFIIEMGQGSGKFALDRLMMKPVLIADKFPLQVPSPISANTGEPKLSTGYIDILALHRVKANKTILSVWELKKPGAYAHAASQAYIYAYTLIKLLRSKAGPEWWDLFGLKRSIPEKIQIEAVVAITPDQMSRFETEKQSMVQNGTPFQFEGGEIILRHACYEEKPNDIRILKTDIQESIKK